MAVLRQKTKAKKAEVRAKSAAADARRAADDSVKAVRDVAQALTAQLGQLGLEDKANDAVERVRNADGYDRAQARVADATGKAQARASEMSNRAQRRASDVSRRVADSDAMTVGREATAEKSAAALAALGSWLSTGERAKQLGIGPARRGRRGWFWALVGVGVGYAIGVLTAPRQGREMREQLVNRAGGGADDNGVGHVGQRDLDGAPVFERPLADRVRTRLGEDPRTSDLPSLNLNVVDGIVVVRGALPDDADPEAVRAVIGDVEGVDEVDLQLGSTS